MVFCRHDARRPKGDPKVAKGLVLEERYLVQAELCSGATASVWRALDLQASEADGNRSVALKVRAPGSPSCPRLWAPGTGPVYTSRRLALALGNTHQSARARQVLRAQSRADLPALSHSVAHHAQREVRARPKPAGRGLPGALRPGSLRLGACHLACPAEETVSRHQCHACGLGSPPRSAVAVPIGARLLPQRRGQQGAQAGADGAGLRAQIESASCLQHPNIVRLLDVFAHGDQLVLVVRCGPSGALGPCNLVV